MDLPERLRNEPELLMGSQLFWTAFQELNTMRSFGLEPGPIPWGAIQEWCDRNEIEGDQRSDVCFHVRMMDSIYLEEVRKKMREK